MSQKPAITDEERRNMATLVVDIMRQAIQSTSPAGRLEIRDRLFQGICLRCGREYSGICHPCSREED